jgi:hypothetical protein
MKVQPFPGLKLNPQPRRLIQHYLLGELPTPQTLKRQVKANACQHHRQAWTQDVVGDSPG